MLFAGIALFAGLEAGYPVLESPDVFAIEIRSKARARFFEARQFLLWNPNRLIAKIVEMFFRDENVLFACLELVFGSQIVSAASIITFPLGEPFAHKGTASKIVATSKFSLDFHGIDEFVVPCTFLWVRTACSDDPISSLSQLHNVRGTIPRFFVFAATKCAEPKVRVRCVTSIMIHDVGKKPSFPHEATSKKNRGRFQWSELKGTTRKTTYKPKLTPQIAVASLE